MSDHRNIAEVPDEDLTKALKEAENKAAAIKNEMSLREARRKQAAKELRAKQVDAFAKLKDKEFIAALDFFVPKHSRTTCSDDKVRHKITYRGDHGDQPECVRCMLLSMHSDSFIDTSLVPDLMTFTFDNT